jgi:hypothetical protein
MGGTRPMTDTTTDDYTEWLRLAEAAFDATGTHRTDASVNPWSQPVAWLAKRDGR